MLHSFDPSVCLFYRMWTVPEVEDMSRTSKKEAGNYNSVSVKCNHIKSLKQDQSNSHGQLSGSHLGIQYAA